MDPRLTTKMMEALSQPFSPRVVNWKPQATSKDGKKALAVPYVDVRDYQHRLNSVMAADWSDDYEVLNEGAVVICRLTVGGVTRTDVGESSPDGQNTATSALAQAFKRACVKFGLGAYLYKMPKRWEEYDTQRRRFSDAALSRLRKLGPTNLAALRYGDGSKLGTNPAETKAYHAYANAIGNPPQDIATLRRWLGDSTKQE
jgi:hypothetical protein